MGIVTTGAAAKLLWPGLYDIFGHEYKEYPLQCNDLYDKHTSDKSFEEVQGIRTFGLAPIKTQGGSISYDEWKQTYLTRFTHVVYGIGCIITREMLEDDQYNIAKIVSGKGGQAVQALAFSLRQTKETVAALKYDRAFNPSFVGGDGVEMCATDHPLDAGGTEQNEPTNASDLSEASLEQGHIDVKAFVNDAGLKIAAQVGTLIIPDELEFEAHRILKSTLQNETANNADNALRALGIVKKIVVNTYLTDTDAWFLRTNVPGLKLFMRREAQFENDSDFDTENVRMKGTERYVFGHDDFRSIYGSPGA